MIEVEGDIFELFEAGEYDAIIIPTNATLNGSGELVMGAGVALEAKKRWPWLPSALALDVDRTVTPIRAADGKRWVISFRTKINWRNPSRMGLVRRSAAALESWVDRRLPGDVKIILPRVGCGYGGLTWSGVKRTLEPFMDDRFHASKGPVSVSSR